MGYVSFREGIYRDFPDSKSKHPWYPNGPKITEKNQNLHSGGSVTRWCGVSCRVEAHVGSCDGWSCIVHSNSGHSPARFFPRKPRKGGLLGCPRKLGSKVRISGL